MEHLAFVPHSSSGASSGSFSELLLGSASDSDAPSYIPTVRVEDFDYDLPPERIAERPLPNRSDSNLLVAELHANDIHIVHRKFADITEILPHSSMVVMNNSRVIAARIPMQKESGGAAEVLCLQPVAPSSDPAVAMLARQSCRWLCMVGGRNIHEGAQLRLRVAGTSERASEREQKSEEPLKQKQAEEPEQYVELVATVVSRAASEAVVEFSWNQPTMSFAEVLHQCGQIPLPPYIKRAAEADDTERYQTVYAEHDGSVAAPTAGLHFTPSMLSELHAKGVRQQYVTLHVGAGTFKPMTSAEAKDHAMHYERIAVERAVIEALAEQTRLRHDAGGHHLIAVGTTSMRTLESLYWWGVRLIAKDGTGSQNPRRMRELVVEQWDAFRLRAQFKHEQRFLPQAALAFEAVLTWMREHSLDAVSGQTQLMIVPGYVFAVCDALVTNFHQPHSTLMLLVAAFLTDSYGQTHWRAVYNAALANGYRFLSYGDASLLIAAR